MVEQVLQQHQYLEQHHNLFMDLLQEFMQVEVEVEHTQLQVETQVEQAEQVEVDQGEQIMLQVELLEQLTLEVVEVEKDLQLNSLVMADQE